jgi:ABC-type sugar transport system substrate-binding protein
MIPVAHGRDTRAALLHDGGASMTTTIDRRGLLGVSAAAAATLATGQALAQGTAIPNRRLRIGFASHSIELQALFGQLREGFRAHLNQAGVQYEFFQAAPDRSNDHAGMLRILEDMANLRLDYLLVGPTSLQLNEPGLEAVARSGAKLLMTDYQRPAGGVPYDNAVLNWVVYSHEEMGTLAGEWLGDHLRSIGKKRPKIVLLWGPAASEISKQRGEGALKGLRSHADLQSEIVYQAHADFDRQKAYDETERALAAYDFDAVIGLNSFMAVSAKNAVQASRKRGQITVVGMGGTIDELQAVALREIGCAPFRDPRAMGRASATALILHLTGREAEITKTVYSDIPVLDNAYRIRKTVPKEMFDVVDFLNKHHA